MRKPSSHYSHLERWNGIPAGEHEDSTLAGLEVSDDNPGMQEFLGAAQKIIDNWQGNRFAGLYLYGTPGVGKSHAAIGLGRALHETGADVFYRYAPNVVRKSHSYWTGTRFNQDLNYDGNGIFATDSYVEKNPKTALIFDDYKPEAQESLQHAVDAAAQFGGLVIVTSNYTDPFKLVEPYDGRSEKDVALDVVIEKIDPEIASATKARRDKVAKGITDSLRSRVAAGFKLIEFTGEDRRQQNSFW